ncbi:hypothetical protein LSH36_853g00010 [Paralvinella palmiformis]|uniref:Uncharacterized protein n=1 Tax=Paralvinella palmiformis TaxID=53620 RepID=A0AAD9J0E7_9ANNE|nr:hypothetical protein LSH36_853g00010 [Paralvinella palmiformis]
MIVRLWEDLNIYHQSRIMYSTQFQHTPKEGLLFHFSVWCC